MNWTLCLVYTLISMTCIGCQHNPRTYHQYDYTDDVGPDDKATQRMSERSIPLDGARQTLQEVQRKLHRHDEETLGDSNPQFNSLRKATQRMCKRSIPLDGARQRLQEVQRRLHRHDEETLGDSNPQFNSLRKGLAPSPSPDVVVFPGPVRRQSSQFLPNVPEECLKTGICEDLPDYPEDHVATVVQSLGNATDRFQIDELDTPEIAQRIGPPEEMELCEFRLKVITPRAAPDKDGNWHYILNPKNKTLQGFHVEICNEDKSPCSKLAYFYSGYEATCKQKFMLRFMVGLDANGQKVEKSFKLPSCCSCVVRQSD